MQTLTTKLPFLLLAAHLIGDFLLQNDDMARNKASSTRACLSHIAAYSTPFLMLSAVTDLPFLAFVAILAQHYAQDRYALHLRWMRFFSQTPPDRWPTGPLAVDQAMHVSFLAVVACFI